MVRAVSIGALIIGGCVLIASYALFAVPPDSVAVIFRGDKILRIEQPGLRLHIPLLESVHHIATQRQYMKTFDVDVKLADKSDCRIAGRIYLRVTDPFRAFAWRKTHGLDLGARGADNDGKGFTAALPKVEQAVRLAAKATTPQAARSGALEKWLATYHSPTLEDGTIILRADSIAVSCSQHRTAQHTPERARFIFGVLRPFAMTRPRPDTVSGATAIDFVLSSAEVILRDSELAEVEGLVISYRIVDPKRFKGAFGSGDRAKQAAADRLTSILQAALRQTLGELDKAGVATFDPYVVMTKQKRLADTQAVLGISLVNIGGAKAGYRLVHRVK